MIHLFLYIVSSFLVYTHKCINIFKGAGIYRIDNLINLNYFKLEIARNFLLNIYVHSNLQVKQPEFDISS